MNQIKLYEWGLSNKRQPKHAQFSCIIKLYVEIKTKTMIQSKFPIFSELSFYFKQLFLIRYLHNNLTSFVSPVLENP